MRVFNYSLLIAALLTVSVNSVQAREYRGEKPKSAKGIKAKAAGCAPAQSLTEFSINNVRTAAETGGNTWYDRGNGNPYYEVPANEGNHAIFAGALWMGGEDPAGNLKLAAIRFRQDGNDFWPGPLSTDGTASVDEATCQLWDRFFLMSRQMVETHRYYFTLINSGIDPSTDPLFEDGYIIPSEILEWPAHGDANLGQSAIIAPFADLRDPVTGEIITTPGLYEPNLGDYPLYDLDQEIDCRTRLVTDPVPLFGDFTMYWVFNDKGNVHTESTGDPIGMEIQAQMFGFTTNDEINNMTFVNYVLINRGTLTLEDTYFAQWVDTDLGNPTDDFVGCDVMRGLGYSYNGDNDDESSSSGPGYGSQPPAIGVDFFEGPYQDPDGINNAYGIGPGEALNGLGYRNPLDSLLPNGIDTIIDNERFGMRRFLFHNNNSGPVPTQDPGTAIEHYNMMRGIWNNGTPMTHGGTGYNPTCQSCLPADFMFPGTSDPLHWGTDGVDPNYPETSGWTEENEGNAPADRRFLQSAGPFTLDPGEFNNITVGVVYARASNGGAFASVTKLFQADDKAQALFDNCFRLLDGPDAPDLTGQELDREILLYIRNTSPLSNNQQEKYAELDPTIPPANTEGVANDRFYRFQGYEIYQLKNSGVSVSDLDDPSLAQRIFQVDIRDFKDSGEPIGQIINYEQDESIGLPVPREMVNGANEGIRHSFRVTTDQFASGDTRLINFKKYYFLAVAYGYNEYESYNPDPNVLSGQPRPYLRGRSGAVGDIQAVTLIPHKPVPEQFGTVFNSEYGEGVPITRLEGAGNGNNNLVLTEETIDAIMDEAPYKADELTYVPGEGPINVRVIDPLNVKPAKFILRFYNDKDPDGEGYIGDFNDASWYMVDLNNPGDTIFSETTIQTPSEQIIPEYGISVSVGQYEYDYVSREVAPNLIRRYPVLLGSGMEFTSGPEGWLGGIPDEEGTNPLNWIRSGANVIEDEPNSGDPCFVLPDGTTDPSVFNDYAGIDNAQIFEDVVDGMFAPARLVAGFDCGVAPFSVDVYNSVVNENADLSTTKSVDIFITPDKSRWSRVPIYEMQFQKEFSQLQKEKMQLRGALSVDKNGRNQLDPDANIEECTYNGTQVLTQEIIADWPESKRTAFLELVSAQYTQIQSIDQLVGLSFGMGYFPGYAISPERGERLNMAFGENSYLSGDNGKDMLWNPTSRITTQLGDQYVVGGEHYIYTFRNRMYEENFDTSPDFRQVMPAYDGGQTVYDIMTRHERPKPAISNEINRLNRAFGWVGFPMLNAGFEFLSPEDGLVPGNVKISAHVAEPYAPYATVRDELGDASIPQPLPDTNYVYSTNFWYPAYEFSTEGIETSVQQTEVAKTALDLIDIVPNPYYAYSAYEQSRVDNRVKFVNLPPECKISIFTINGTLINVFEKDNPNTYLEWNLQNENFIPISGGMYLIHVQSPGLGERVLKFFAATRPTDLRNF